MTHHPKFKTAPVISTERLILRPHQNDDFPDYEAMFQDEVFTKFTTATPLAREDAWAKMIRHGGHWSCMGFGYWAIEEKTTGRFVGELGFADFKRDLSPSFEGKMEAGWGLVSNSHGKGYAAEALVAALAWQDEFYPDMEVVCMIAPDNSPSIRLAEKHGFVFWQASTYKIYKTTLFKRE